MLPAEWSLLNLLAWAFGVYAVHSLRAQFDPRARTWVLLTWAIWPCFLMEASMAAEPYVPGLETFSAVSGVSSGLFLWLAFRSLTHDVRADATALLASDRWDRRAAWSYAAVLAAAIASSTMAPSAAHGAAGVARWLEGATWLVAPAALISTLTAANMAQAAASVYTPGAFGVAFTLAFAHAALAPITRVTGLAIPPAAGFLLETLFILTFVVALYSLLLRLRVQRLLEATAQVHTMQEQLFSLEKIAALSTLAAGAAHDFRNALHVILGHTELALEAPDVPDETRDDLRAIRAAATSASAVAQDLLGIVRRPAAAHALQRLSEAVRAPLSGLAREFERQHITVVTDLDDSASPAADLDLISQVCLNLFLNARDAMVTNGGGTLDVRFVNRSDTVEIVVRDTGTGIPRAFQSRVFQPLQTTKGERGTGLGLSTSRSLVRAMGGDIVFDTEEGTGTTFRVRLPVGEPAAGTHGVRTRTGTGTRTS